MLNKNAKPGAFFQVLNFGHGASQSYTDLQFMISMGSYLQPDVSILLDGFNDAFFATESSVSTAPYPYVIGSVRNIVCGRSVGNLKRGPHDAYQARTS
jgi:hypothetical protein